MILHPLPSGLLHDLRTPLNHILGYSEMLVEQAEEAGQADLVPHLEKVRAAGHRLLSIINENFRSTRSHEGEPVPLDVRLSPVGAAEEATAAAGPPPGSELARGNVLVVDDIEANRDVLSQRLRRQGYAVRGAGTGPEAIELLRSESFDLVLLDIMMPGMDGYEVLGRLKADERLRHIPVVMISAIHELESVARCIEMGADDYLTKPFNPTLLQARIGSSIARKRARDREILLFDELQEKHERLRELEGSRDAATAAVVAELRGPLEAVVAELAWLEGAVELTETQRVAVAAALAAGARVLEARAGAGEKGVG